MSGQQLSFAIKLKQYFISLLAAARERRDDLEATPSRRLSAQADSTSFAAIVKYLPR